MMRGRGGQERGGGGRGRGGFDSTSTTPAQQFEGVTIVRESAGNVFSQSAGRGGRGGAAGGRGRGTSDLLDVSQQSAVGRGGGQAVGAGRPPMVASQGRGRGGQSSVSVVDVSQHAIPHFQQQSTGRGRGAPAHTPGMDIPQQTSPMVATPRGRGGGGAHLGLGQSHLVPYGAPPQQPPAAVPQPLSSAVVVPIGNTEFRSPPSVDRGIYSTVPVSRYNKYAPRNREAAAGPLPPAPAPMQHHEESPGTNMKEKLEMVGQASQQADEAQKMEEEAKQQQQTVLEEQPTVVQAYVTKSSVMQPHVMGPQAMQPQIPGLQVAQPPVVQSQVVQPEMQAVGPHQVSCAGCTVRVAITRALNTINSELTDLLNTNINRTPPGNDPPQPHGH